MSTRLQDTYSQRSFDFSLPDTSSPATTNSLTLNSPAQNDDHSHLGSRNVIVDPIRLSDRGDISASYSADLISNGRVRKPFRYNDQLYTTTSTMSGRYPDSVREAEAYRLVPATLFEGHTIEFRTKINRDNGNAARSDPNGFYHAIPITYQSRHYVLAGPSLTFLPNLPRT